MILNRLAVADFNLLGKRLRAERLGVIGGSLGNAPSLVAKRANQRCQQLLVVVRMRGLICVFLILQADMPMMPAIGMRTTNIPQLSFARMLKVLC